MDRIRSYYDADRIERFPPSKHKTVQNRNELVCSTCGDIVFADDFVFKDVSRAIEQTSENPFLCEDCLNDYDDVSHQ